ncbi:hypothetical protein BDV26DRAFT_289059 [Aspergillus bertholletiae]|uniref:Uncharacterized protein n=1 Tax=Aspergillus bertholletiae TaxID=1226010 RepID=A0A5N7BJ87_9EURO|nr:hypothetical protein BDV26DRAFT_289059 [Aspergillus bertholletiae]
MRDRHIILPILIVLIAPAHVLGLREDSPLARDIYDLQSNLRAKELSAAPASAIVQTSEAAVRSARAAVNMASAYGPVIHAVPTSLAHRARCAVMGGAIPKVANAATTGDIVVLGTTAERTGGK